MEDVRQMYKKDKEVRITGMLQRVVDAVPSCCNGVFRLPLRCSTRHSMRTMPVATLRFNHWTPKRVLAHPARPHFSTLSSFFVSIIFCSCFAASVFLSV